LRRESGTAVVRRVCSAQPIGPGPLRPGLFTALCCGATLACAQGYSGDASLPAGSAGPIAQAEGQASTQGVRRANHFGASVLVEETFTNNVNLHAKEARQGDFISEVAPRVNMSGSSAYASGEANISLPMFFYARTGSENNRIVPQVSATGLAELVRNHVFVDGSVNVTQEYFSPFGARSQNLATRTNNEYTAQTYRVSPFIRGTTPGDLSYEVRDNNVWTKLGSASALSNDSYLNELLAQIARAPAPIGWALDYKRDDLSFQGSQSQTTEIAHARLLYRLNPQTEVSISGGYEDATFPSISYNDVTYGAGLRWRPSERTSVDANWEHRFFGTAYHVVGAHRTPLTSWTLSASRDVSSYPQALAQLQAGGVTASLLDSVFRSRLPDPVLRQQFVQQYMQDHALPATLLGPVSVYNQLITLQENVTATGGIIGARNVVMFSAYRARIEPLPGNLGLPLPLADAQNNNTQVGGSVQWTYNFSRSMTLGTTANYSHTTSNGSAIGDTDFASLRTILSSSLSPKTSVHAGAGYQQSRSNISEDFEEFSVFVGLTYVFQ